MLRKSVHDGSELLWPVDVSLFSELGREGKKKKENIKLSHSSVWLVFNGCGENYCIYVIYPAQFLM